MGRSSIDDDAVILEVLIIKNETGVSFSKAVKAYESECQLLGNCSDSTRARLQRKYRQSKEYWDAKVTNEINRRFTENIERLKQAALDSLHDFAHSPLIKSIQQLADSPQAKALINFAHSPQAEAIRKVAVAYDRQARAMLPNAAQIARIARTQRAVVKHMRIIGKAR